ncbi:DNA replication and repair protein RecF [Candidatus Daviesbacteria bacterium]|nr:DNA replication and repair protein RecF [Candidatus Daviesbacteria bacterium]
MFIKQLNLTNFRNYSNLSLNFDHRPTIFVGNNAVGKSNILEAIYLLSTTKSARVEIEGELIKNGSEFAKVEGLVKEEGGTKLLIILNNPAEASFIKKVLVNGIARRVVDFVGNLPAVIFHPSDINMVTGSPSLRRWQMDLCLAQVDFGYKKALTQYEHFLTSRNRVLKRIREGVGHADELIYWTGELLNTSKTITEKRTAFFNYIINLPPILGNFRFNYHPSRINQQLLEEINDREVAAAATLIGPHRDDFDIIFYDGPGRNLAHFGSRGEQRISTLAFKLAQLEYMAKILGQRPVLLLDDVFSELDASHRACVAEIVGKQQTIIATVELENIPKDFLNQSRILRVEDGKIIE